MYNTVFDNISPGWSNDIGFMFEQGGSPGGVQSFLDGSQSPDLASLRTMLLASAPASPHFVVSPARASPSVLQETDLVLDYQSVNPTDPWSTLDADRVLKDSSTNPADASAVHAPDVWTNPEESVSPVDPGAAECSRVELFPCTPASNTASFTDSALPLFDEQLFDACTPAAPVAAPAAAAPLEQPVEAPAAAAPLEQPAAAAPLEQPVEAPAATAPLEQPVAARAASPTDSPPQSPTDSSPQSPTDLPPQSPTDSPPQSPTDSPQQSPADSPQQPPADSPMESPRDASPLRSPSSDASCDTPRTPMTPERLETALLSMDDTSSSFPARATHDRRRSRSRSPSVVQNKKVKFTTNKNVLDKIREEIDGASLGEINCFIKATFNLMLNTGVSSEVLSDTIVDALGSLSLSDSVTKEDLSSIVKGVSVATFKRPDTDHQYMLSMGTNLIDDLVNVDCGPSCMQPGIHPTTGHKCDGYIGFMTVQCPCVPLTVANDSLSSPLFKGGVFLRSTAATLSANRTVTRYIGMATSHLEFNSFSKHDKRRKHAIQVGTQGNYIVPDLVNGRPDCKNFAARVRDGGHRANCFLWEDRRERVWLVVKERDIAPGEELLIDFNVDASDGDDEMKDATFDPSDA
ncbi:hypothetical protein T484DRAFT_1753850 [Baffinella frigidus]|nr:hypothetical protein T484DRAFT_1753850 [Cryptophyta sp. CCMP2293]